MAWWADRVGDFYRNEVSKMKFCIRYLPLVVSIFIAEASLSQDMVRAERSSYTPFLGSQFGRTLVHLDTRMRLHNRFGVGLQLARSRRPVWDINLEYYEADGAWEPRAFEYKGYTLIVQNVQYIVSYGLDLSLSVRQTRFASVGAGLSVEYFRVETITNDWRYPFYIDVGSDSFVPWGAEKRKIHFFSPGLFLMSELHHSLGHASQIYVKPLIKVAYIGKSYHAEPLDSWITFTVYGGIRLKI